MLYFKPKEAYIWQNVLYVRASVYSSLKMTYWDRNM